MTPIERQILESLQYLLWTHQPRSEMSEERKDKLMVKNHLLLNPIQKEEPCCEIAKNRIEDAITADNTMELKHDKQVQNNSQQNNRHATDKNQHLSSMDESSTGYGVNLQQQEEESADNNNVRRWKW